MHRTLPRAAIAMNPAFTDQILTPAVRRRIARHLDLPTNTVLTELHSPAARAALAGTEVLITGWGCPPLDAAALDAAPALQAVVHTAGTVRTLVTDACWERDIAVTTAAAANALPVAEYTLAMILLANKHILEGARDLSQRRGAFDDPAYGTVPGNYRKTVALLSASLIGRRVIELLRPHDLDVIIHDPYLSEDEARRLGVRLVSLADLFALGDVVSVHTPLLPQTINLVGERELAAMRPGSILINTARGRVVDHDALTRHLLRGRIRAVLDVTDPEPLPSNSPLYDLPNVLITPHIAGSQGGELARLGDCAADEIEHRALTGTFRHPVHHAHLAHIA